VARSRSITMLRGSRAVFHGKRNIFRTRWFMYPRLSSFFPSVEAILFNRPSNDAKFKVKSSRESTRLL